MLENSSTEPGEEAFRRSHPREQPLGGGAPTYDVIIVGAGPVGLSLALALSDSPLRVLLLEQRTERTATSRAIGITPASLEIFHRFGVAEELVRRGVAVEGASIHGDAGPVASVRFAPLPSPFPFILSLPQRETEETLGEVVSPRLAVRRGLRVTDFQIVPEVGWHGSHGVDVVARDESGSRRVFRAGVLVACDGKRSTIREIAGVGVTSRRLNRHFVMADLFGDVGLPREKGALFFTHRGSVESFPLPRGSRRWIAQVPEHLEEAPPGLTQRLVGERTGIDLSAARESWRSSFSTERNSAVSWAKPPLFLAGDAAHLMPPIGGQGMNVGIADAEHLADGLILAYRGDITLYRLAATYEARRRRAFRVAARRSILGMRIGTLSGRLPSAARSAVLSRVLKGAVHQRVIEHFAMLSSPNRRSPWQS